MTTFLTHLPLAVLVGALAIVAGWTYASGPGRRARQRRHDAWTRYIRRNYRGGESARGEP